MHNLTNKAQHTYLTNVIAEVNKLHLQSVGQGFIYILDREGRFANMSTTALPDKDFDLKDDGAPLPHPPPPPKKTFTFSCS